MTHLALYGNVAIERGMCPACERMALILDRCYACCGTPVYESATRIKRIVEPEFVRRRPSPASQREILDLQAHCCAYCDRPFGSWIHTGEKPLQLVVEWDHVTPFCHTANNHPSNFVAACQVCNAIKHDLIFDSLEDIRVHVALKWEARDFADLKERA